MRKKGLVVNIKFVKHHIKTPQLAAQQQINIKTNDQSERKPQRLKKHTRKGKV